MTGSLQRRIRNLEAGGRECPECGFDGDWSKVKYEVAWCDDKDEDDGPHETVYCETCGEPVHIVVTWGDLPEERLGKRAVVYDDAWERRKP
jgi:hypothetical protein